MSDSPPVPPSSPSLYARLARLRAQGIDPYPTRSTCTHTLAQIAQLLQSPAGFAPVPITVAGRIVGLDAARVHLQDLSGSLWCEWGEGVASTAHTVLQVGDQVGGGLILSPAGSLQISNWSLLAPALQPVESTPVPAQRPGGGASIDALQKRARVLRGIRHFFDQRAFTEIETPIMAKIPGLEPHLDPFESRFRATATHPGEPVFLLTSPEYALKRVLVSGLERVYQISKVFRNGEVGPFHNPEFSMLEWYRTHASYLEIMEDLEGLVLELMRGLKGSGAENTLCWQGHTVDVTPPWPRVTVREAFLQTTGIDLAEAQTAEQLQAAAARAGIPLPNAIDWEEAFFRILIERVEPTLGYHRPVFLTDYPAPFAALARVRPEAFPVAERFELYIAGVEVGNAYSELTDPQLQAERFESERQQRAALGLPVFEPDADYLRALEQGLPPTGGIAVGVDRLVMLLLDLPDVRHSLAFPFPMAEAGCVQS